MAIWFLTGLPGNGKTLYAMARYVLPALRRGRFVYHNIEGFDGHRASLIPAYFGEIDPQGVDACLGVIPEDCVFRFWEHVASGPNPINSLIIIDECQNYWSARDFASASNKDLVKYLTMHRHLGHDVLFITQHQDNVDVAVRRMVDLSYLVVNNKTFFSSKSSRVYTYNRDNIGRNLDIVSSVYKYDRRIFGLYSSYQSGGVTETKVSVKWWLNFKLLFFCVLVLIGVLWFWRNSSGSDSYLFGGKSRSLAEESKKKRSASSSSSSPSDFLGDYKEYYCGDKFYVLRPSGSHDSYDPKTIPRGLCPYVGFISKGGVPNEQKKDF